MGKSETFAYSAGNLAPDTSYSQHITQDCHAFGVSEAKHLLVIYG